MDAFQKALDLIPEASYDLIARLLPGGIALASFASTYSLGFYGFTIDGSSGFVAVAIFLVLSYATGLVLSTLAHPLYWLTWPFVYCILAKHTDAGQRLTEALDRALGTQSQKLEWKNPLGASVILDRAHDLIKKRDPSQGLVVTKLSAEVALVYGLSLATGLFSVLNCGRFWFVPVVLLVLGYLRSVRLWQRHATILQAVTAQG